MVTTYAVCNQKGGVGKSTTTFQLARAAARAGSRVLLVDLDPQGNLTAAAAEEPVAADQVGLADVLSARESLEMREAIVPGVWEGLDVVPTSGEALGVVRDELVVAGPGRESRLRERLADVASDYDLVLIDCPPALDQLTINALVAADSVVVVTQTKLWSTDGLAHLLDTVDTVRAYYHPGLRVAGIVLNGHEQRTVSGAHWRKEIETAAAARKVTVLDPPVPRRALIADATEASLGIDQWPHPDAEAIAALYEGYLTQIEGENR